MPELIIEFYSEEIPADLQEWAAGHIEMMIAKDFKEANLNYQKSESFWSPMRFYSYSMKITSKKILTRRTTFTAKMSNRKYQF